jgi:hypothetical protein
VERAAKTDLTHLVQKITASNDVKAGIGVFDVRKGNSQMSHATKSERLQIVLTPEELDTLDDWRFAHRMPSRAAAIRELIKRGLAALDGKGNGNGDASAARNARRSRDVRIIERKGSNGNGGMHAK